MGRTLHPPTRHAKERKQTMKTAEEWANWHDNRLPAEEIKQIQLDAFKAGERFAAELVRREAKSSIRLSLSNLAEAILTDANNRTTLP